MANTLHFVKATRISLKDHGEFDEAWLRNVIVDDPSIFGLGDLDIKEIERMQPKAGRLDLLLQDSEIDKRYEVEIMLGRVDESHIIRCIEYWDVERKRLPAFDHCAVLVAEDITTRFLNVISLFNGAIPMIALQLNAMQIDDKLILNFTKVLDEISAGAIEEVDEPAEVRDRNYWVQKGSELSMVLADECLEVLREFDKTLVLTYNKHYIGLRQGNRPNNFIILKPKKTFLRIEVYVTDLDSVREELNNADIEVIGIGKRRRAVRFIINKGDIPAHRETLKNIFLRAYKESTE